jgi:aldehyde dehydrogenase (NAD+)
VNLVHGFSGEIGSALVDHPSVKLVTFTGDTLAGREIASRVATRLARVSLELSAKNALIVNADADVELALLWATRSAFATNGQRETAASRIIVHADLYDRFVDEFVKRASSLRIGDPMDAETELGPVISSEQLDAVEKYVRRLQEAGGRILCGGRRAGGSDLESGYFYLPTVVAGVSPASELTREEVLGPVTTVFRAADIDEAVAMANAVPYGLCSAIFTASIELALKVADQFETGVAWVNAGTIGAEVGLPFGGTKDSGVGTTEWGQGAIDTFSQWKTTYINYGRELRMVFEDTRLW